MASNGFMQPTNLFLIRHGEAHVNVNPGGPVAGMKGDAGLTDLGRKQAERLRDRLAASGEIQADVFIASTLPRARQTAEIIQPAIGLDIIWDDEVQELRVGDLDGEIWDEVVKEHGLPDFRRDPFRAFAPGGENWPQFILRVATTLDRIAREHAGKTVVIVTHGGMIDGSFLAFFNIGAVTQPPNVELYTHNTSISQWQRYVTDSGYPRWRLARYNDDLHVRDLVVDERYRWRKLYEGADTPAVPLPTESDSEER
jgi:probable phosphoglycerate mutase